MSNPGNSSTIGNMGSPFFHEIKKQASFFLKEKIKTARLVLTDVTPAQLLTEEATNGNPGVPDTRVLKIISKAAFEIDDYSRIVEILHKRFASFDKKSWRLSYNSLLVLEHLLTHGPESVSKEFEADKDAIIKAGSFQYVDEKGFNWGLTVRKKSERILKLLENRPFLKEERNRARTVTRGIEGFGSLNATTTFTYGIVEKPSGKTFNKSNSQFNYYRDEEDNIPSLNRTYSTSNLETQQQTYSENLNWQTRAITLNKHRSFKENTAPKDDRDLFEEEGFEDWDSKGEDNPLLSENNTGSRTNAISIDDDHPFDHSDHLSGVSLLSSSDHILQAC